MTSFYNRTDQREKRRALRADAPPAEQRLWQVLRGKRCAGYKFRRQYSVGPYVLDFYCPALKLAIEIDGSSHDGDEAVAYDAARQKYVEGFGIRFLRFTNADVNENLEGVLAMIPPPNPLLSKEGEPTHTPSPCEGEGRGGVFLPPLAGDTPPPDPLLSKEGEQMPSSATGNVSETLPPLAKGRVGEGSQ